MLYGPDATPLDTTDGNKLLCVVKDDPRSPGRSVDVPGWEDDWQDWDDVSPQSLIGQLWDDMESRVESPESRVSSCVWVVRPRNAR